MDPEKWKTVKAILEDTLKVAAADRAAFLERECPDPQIRAEVASLMAFDDNGAGALENEAAAVLLAHRTDADTVIKDTLIGKYRIDREIGSGGMGTVYLAHRADGEFDQKVAIKLIKGGIHLDTLFRRFINERRILASLEHPNIARLIDGGTTDDRRPYLVMEYVEGLPITEYAAQKDLDIRQRLDLFQDVCSAVSLAHQNLIIHRDLKPSNILVGKDGIPKLLDFGIAKILSPDDSDGSTQTQHFAFTPEYASPEQIRGENLTTSTDVYSLGVVLYELLTGRRPFSFEGKGIGQIVSIATQNAPARPSAKAARPEERKPLEGDLDNIVLKSLSKEPERRYPTVDQFADDVRRHLKGLPVRARQDTFGYRAGKFARRNPLLVGSAVLTFVVLIAGIVATTYLARQAEAERNLAQNRFNDLRALANSFIFEINDTIADSPIRARELLVSRSIEYLDRLAAESADDESLRSELAAAYEKIGDVQAEFFGSSTGDSAKALASHQKALEIRLSQHKKYPENDRYTLALAATQLKIAGVFVTTGRTELAPPHYDSAVALLEGLAVKHPEDDEVKFNLANAYAKQGQGILRTGSISSSLEKFERAAGIASNLSQKRPGDARTSHLVSVYESYAGYAKLEMGRKEEANRHFQRALQIDSSIFQADTSNAGRKRDLATAELWAGIGLRGSGDLDKSLEHLYRALKLEEELYAIDSSNLGYVNSLADANLEIGWTLTEKSQGARAARHLEEAISLYNVLISSDARNLSARRQAAFARLRLGEALAAAGNKAESRAAFEKALGEIESILRSNERNSEFRHDMAVCLLRLAEIDRGPEERLRKAIEILEELTRESPEHQARAGHLAAARELLSRIEKAR